MPYISEKLKIVGTKYDRRMKLTPEDKIAIRELYKEGGHSQRSLARLYNVSRRLIVFTLYPERLKINVENHDSKKYYDRKKWAITMREHRAYKQSLYVKGLLKGGE